MSDVIFFQHENEEYGFLILEYQTPFEVEGIAYKNAAQYVAAKKALLFGDLTLYEHIMAEKNASMIKAFSKRISPFDAKIWESAAEDILFNANMAKFSQNPELLKSLLRTGDSILIYAEASDPFLGIGLNADSPDVEDKGKWNGKNILGNVLKNVRKEIQE